jgi:hypothetical protein
MGIHRACQRKVQTCSCDAGNGIRKSNRVGELGRWRHRRIPRLNPSQVAFGSGVKSHLVAVNRCGKWRAIAPISSTKLY